MADQEKKSISRSLGEFVGFIWHGVKADVNKDKRVVRREVQEEERETSTGKVTLRRTIIEEVELPEKRREPKGEGRASDERAEE